MQDQCLFLVVGIFLILRYVWSYRLCHAYLDHDHAEKNFRSHLQEF